MNDYTIESFIAYCDDMMIVEEGLITNIKLTLIKVFTKLVRFLTDKVSKMKDGKVKVFLLKLLSKAKSGLSKSKALNENNKEEAEKLQQEADEIQRQINEINEKKASKSFDYEKREKVYIDEVGSGDVREWFSEKFSKCNNSRGLVMLATKENVDQCKLSSIIKPNDHIIIQIVIDMDTDTVVALREIHFSEMRDNMAKLLDNNTRSIVITN